MNHPLVWGISYPTYPAALPLACISNAALYELRAATFPSVTSVTSATSATLATHLPKANPCPQVRALRNQFYLIVIFLYLSYNVLSIKL
jgi:hypothetical protein